jgi:hypothetical protein
VTCRSHQIRKHKFNVTCPDVLLMEIAPGPLKIEN